MTKLQRTLTISAFFVALASTASTASAQLNLGIRIGEPPAPRAFRVPARPGPEYVWVEGYQYPQGSHYRWHNGYWTRPPYEGAYWVAPYHSGDQYFAGRWEGSRATLGHDHRWDRNLQRDWRRDPGRND